MKSDENLISGLGTSIFSDNNAKFQRELSFGKKILATAWLVEILAATLGLLIAFFVSYDAYTQISDESNNALLGAILGALPFVLIAIIEPTKIPLASGFYRVKKLGWKLLILAALLGLTAVTFETMFTGLERQLTNVSLQVTRGQAERLYLENQISDISNEISEIQGLELDEELAVIDRQRQNILDQFERSLEELQSDYEIETQAILDSISDQQERAEAIRASELEFVDDRIEAQVERIENFEHSVADLGQITRERQRQLESDAQISAWRQQIVDIDDRIDRVSNLINSGEQEQIAQAQAIISVNQDGRVGPNTQGNFAQWEQQQLLNISDIEEQIAQRRRELEEMLADAFARRSEAEDNLTNARLQLQTLRDERAETSRRLVTEPATFGDELIRIEEVISERRQQLALIEQEFQSRREVIVSERELQISNNNQLRAERETSIIMAQNTIPTREGEIEDLRQRVSELIANMRSAALHNQVYRIAQRYNGHDDVLEVTEEELTFIATIWFGSIALICSVIGTVLALIANIMTDPDAFVEKQKARRIRPVQRGLRRLFILMRRKLLRRPDTVEKIVEVEKVVEVEKEVEKVIEVEKFIEKEVLRTVEVEVDRFVPEIIPVPIFLSGEMDPTIEMAKAEKLYSEINKRFNDSVDASKPRVKQNP